MGLLALRGWDEVVGVGDAQHYVEEVGGGGKVDLLEVSDDDLADRVAVPEAEHSGPVLACWDMKKQSIVRTNPVLACWDRRKQSTVRTNPVLACWDRRKQSTNPVLACWDMMMS